MASQQQIKHRIGSIRGTRQITKAMQLVSASKLRRAQQYAAASRSYADLASELLIRLGGIAELERDPFFAKRPIGTRLYVVVTSNTGLAGAYNANVLKLLTQNLKSDQAKRVASKVIVVGNRGAQFVRRLQGIELLSAFPAFDDHPTQNDVRPLLNTIIDLYKTQAVDEVRLLYTQFFSTIKQEVRDIQLMPAQAPAADTKAPVISNFEPDVETVINEVTTRLIDAEVWQAALESLASEHAMRMVAMKSATDNAKDLIDDYTLELNTARQAAITQELAEITGGAEAMR